MSQKRGTRFFPKNRKGQFFLVAAMIIIVAVVSIVGVSNYVQKKEVIKLYDLGEELGIESQHVLDYGTYSQLNESQMKILMENFIKNYVNYLDEENINLYFIFGNKDKVNVIGYQDIEEEVNICFDGTEDCSLLEIGGTQEFMQDSGEIETVFVVVGSTEYPFNLTEGENFYFIIWQEIGGEKHVVTNE